MCFLFFDYSQVFLTTALSVQSASLWYAEENRPYEFGYAIEGNQHRHETKDANGIIMGEYGFITADNVYHVTVIFNLATGFSY